MFQPEFGLNIVTPPRNRQAKALISPVSGVSVPASNDNTRTSGVGDEAEDDGEKLTTFFLTYWQAHRIIYAICQYIYVH